MKSYGTCLWIFWIISDSVDFYQIVESKNIRLVLLQQWEFRELLLFLKKLPMEMSLGKSILKLCDCKELPQEGMMHSWWPQPPDLQWVSLSAWWMKSFLCANYPTALRIHLNFLCCVKELIEATGLVSLLLWPLLVQQAEGCDCLAGSSAGVRPSVLAGLALPPWQLGNLRASSHAQNSSEDCSKQRGDFHLILWS